MGKAFFDDTANTARNFLGFGGFVAEEQAWTDLQGKWLARNKSHNISKFHACVYPKLVPEYAELVLQHEIYLLGYTIDRQAYREYAALRKRDPFGVNEWASTAEGCMDLLLDWLGHFPEKDCALVFAKDDFKASIEEMWLAVQKRRSNGKRLVSCTATSDHEEFPQLQVADLGAYLTCKYTNARYYSGPVNKIAQTFYDSRHFIKIMHITGENIHKLADMVTKTLVADEIEDTLYGVTYGREQ
jgi:hypothetical protein